MAIGDLYRLVRTVQIDGQEHINVIHFLQTEDYPAGLGTPEEALIYFWDYPDTPANSVELKMLALQTGYTSLVLVSLSAQRIQPTEGDIVSSPIQSTPPINQDSGLPTFAQFKVGIVTGRPDRSGRGGFYIGGIPENQTQGNVVANTYVPQQSALLNQLVENFSPGSPDYKGFAIGVYSRLHNVFNNATVLTASTVLGTMRSRRAGRGS